MIKVVSQKNVSPINCHTEESEYVIENQSTKESVAKKAISSFPQVSNNLISKLSSVTVENKNFAKLFLTATVFASQFLNAAAKSGPKIDYKLYNIGDNMMMGSAFAMVSIVVFAAIYFTCCFCCCKGKKTENREEINKVKEKWGVRIMVFIGLIGLALLLTGYGITCAAVDPNS